MNDAERGPGAYQDSRHCWGLGHFKGADLAHQQPLYGGLSPRRVLVKESGRILPLSWGGLEGDGPWSAFSGSLRTKYPEQFVFSSQI